MATADKLLSIAAGELGRTENPPDSNRTKYGAWMGLDGQPWCMSFVQWCFDRAGSPLPYRTGSCSALLNWYRKNRPGSVVQEPRPGDIILYSFGHTGILESHGGSTVTAIEGNTSAGEAGSQDNGGGVYRRTRRKSLVKAYIRPEFEEADMDVKRFTELWREMRKGLQDNDSGKYSQEARAWAVDSGLVNGSGTLQDGAPNYMWEDVLTREQLVTVLFRFAKRAGLL